MSFVISPAVLGIQTALISLVTTIGTVTACGARPTSPLRPLRQTPSEDAPVVPATCSPTRSRGVHPGGPKT